MLLRALAAEIGPEERLITIERALELGLEDDPDAHPDIVPMEERLPNAEGEGAVPMRELLMVSKRMRPDRVIVGEVLGDEILVMLNAMMQGNDGSLSTIHSNSSEGIVENIFSYAVQAPERLPRTGAISMIANGLDFLVFVRRYRGDGTQRRVVHSVREIVGYDEHGLKTNEIFQPGPDGRSPSATSRSPSASRLEPCARPATATSASPTAAVGLPWSPRLLGIPLAVGLLGIGRRCAVCRCFRAVVDVVRAAPAAPASADSAAHVLGAAVGVVAALLVTRSLVLGVIAGAAVVLWPLIAGGGKAERAALAKLEALAQWTESLRDLAQKGAGLESVIPRTVDTASDVLVGPLRLMSRRLSVKVPLPEALSLFADEVDDPSADMVVGALALAARQRRGKLSDVLTALSASLRDELEQRTKVMRERNVHPPRSRPGRGPDRRAGDRTTCSAPPSLPASDGGARSAAAGDPRGRVRVRVHPGPQARRTRTPATVPVHGLRGPRGRHLPTQGVGL